MNLASKKAYQLFIILFLIPLSIFLISIITNFLIGLILSVYLSIFLSQRWLYEVTFKLNSYFDEKAKFDLKIMNVASIIVLTFMALIIALVAFKVTKEQFDSIIILPLIIGSISQFYFYWIAARVMNLSLCNEEPSFSRATSYFFEFSILPVTIWTIQPSVLSIIEEKNTPNML